MKTPFLLTWLALSFVAGLSPLSAATASRPNVVILLADDAGWGDYSQSGNLQVRTPNIDSLARGGVSLDRFFVCPVCSPTRAEFLTGRYYPRTGVRGVSSGTERFSPQERTLAHAFKDAGYATGIFGKWHSGAQWPYHPNARGFDEFVGYTSGHWGEYFDPPLEHNGQPIRGKGYIVDYLTDRALEFIDKNREQPFLCYVPFTTPHSPWSVPAADWDRFKAKALTQSATDPSKENQDHTRAALAMMENQDANVGRILQRLEELKLADNTIVVYFTDNGPNTARWNGGMKGIKGSTDEGGIRSPLFLRWPAKVAAGRVVKEISGAIDLLPTLTTLAGIPLPGDAPIDGLDLSTRLLGAQTTSPYRMLFSTWNGGFSVRTPTHRLGPDGELYDMIADPGQTKPVTAQEPQLTARLSSALKSWKTEMYGENPPVRTATDWGDVDPRPLPVGYREFPRSFLPASEAVPQGTVRRSTTSPNSSYFVNWTSPADQMVWQLDVHTNGNYAVEILYTCPLPDAGSTIELSLGDSRLTGKVTPGWDPPLYTNQDTLPRAPTQSKMKEFRTLSLGPISLQAGQGPLTLRALEIPGRQVMDVRGIALTLQP